MSIHKNLSIALHELQMCAIDGAPLNKNEHTYALQLLRQLADCMGYELVATNNFTWSVVNSDTNLNTETESHMAGGDVLNGHSRDHLTQSDQKRINEEVQKKTLGTDSTDTNCSNAPIVQSGPDVVSAAVAESRAVINARRRHQSEVINKELTESGQYKEFAAKIHSVDDASKATRTLAINTKKPL